MFLLRLMFPPVLQSQQQPQNLHPGKSVRLCQAETLRTAVNRQGILSVIQAAFCALVNTHE